jgi:hypothetical protein
MPEVYQHYMICYTLDFVSYQVRSRSTRFSSPSALDINSSSRCIDIRPACTFLHVEQCTIDVSNLIIARHQSLICWLFVHIRKRDQVAKSACVRSGVSSLTASTNIFCRYSKRTHCSCSPGRVIDISRHLFVLPSELREAKDPCIVKCQFVTVIQKSAMFSSSKEAIATP